MIELLADPTEHEAAAVRRLPRVIIAGNPHLETLLNLPVRLGDRIMRLGDAPHPSGRSWSDFLAN